MYTIIDLTQTLDSDSCSYPGTAPAMAIHRVKLANRLATLTRFDDLDPHAGTHLDAPLHFAPEGDDVMELPLRLLPTTVVPVDGSCIDGDAVPADCTGRAVLFSTGWETRAGTPGYYRGFPYLTVEAAQRLVGRGVALVGMDTPSADGTEYEPSYPVHELLCGAGVPIVEGLVNLRALLAMGGEMLFAALPLKLRGIEGSPVRAVALVREGPPAAGCKTA